MLDGLLGGGDTHAGTEAELTTSNVPSAPARDIIEKKTTSFNNTARPRPSNLQQSSNPFSRTTAVAPLRVTLAPAVAPVSRVADSSAMLQSVLGPAAAFKNPAPLPTSKPISSNSSKQHQRTTAAPAMPAMRGTDLDDEDDDDFLEPAPRISRQTLSFRKPGVAANATAQNVGMGASLKPPLKGQISIAALKTERQEDIATEIPQQAQQQPEEVTRIQDRNTNHVVSSSSLLNDPSSSCLRGVVQSQPSQRRHVFQAPRANRMMPLTGGQPPSAPDSTLHAEEYHTTSTVRSPQRDLAVKHEQVEDGVEIIDLCGASQPAVQQVQPPPAIAAIFNTSSNSIPHAQTSMEAAADRNAPTFASARHLADAQAYPSNRPPGPNLAPAAPPLEHNTNYGNYGNNDSYNDTSLLGFWPSSDAVPSGGTNALGGSTAVRGGGHGTTASHPRIAIFDHTPFDQGDEWGQDAEEERGGGGYGGDDRDGGYSNGRQYNGNDGQYNSNCGRMNGNRADWDWESGPINAPMSQQQQYRSGPTTRRSPPFDFDRNYDHDHAQPHEQYRPPLGNIRTDPGTDIASPQWSIPASRPAGMPGTNTHMMTSSFAASDIERRLLNAGATGDTILPGAGRTAPPQGERTNTRPWWYRLPDLVPVAVLQSGRNPRDGSQVLIDYKNQFSGKSGGGATAEGKRAARAAGVAERAAGGGGGTGRGAKRQRGEGASAQGHWVTMDGQKVYIDAKGRELRGSAAYSASLKESGKGGTDAASGGGGKKKGKKGGGGGRRRFAKRARN